MTFDARTAHSAQNIEKNLSWGVYSETDSEVIILINEHSHLSELFKTQ